MNTAFIVGAIAFCTLVLELAISRLSVFYLDYSSSYVAIPVALLGLAIGSLYIHMRRNSEKGINIQRHLLLFLIFSFISFAAVFFIFGSVFEFERSLFIYRQTLLYVKTLIFILIFIPPFFFGGTILTVLFTQERARIGQIYAADLFAAALACFLTPFIFHNFDLPYLILLYFLVMVSCLAVNAENTKRRLMNVLIFTPISIGLTMILVHFESHYDLSNLVRTPTGGKTTEIAHRWNEYSRVSLLKSESADSNYTNYRIIHDNAESNVVVQPFWDSYPYFQEQALTFLPYVVDPAPKDALVMFAGGGAQMIDFYHFNHGAKIVDGAEINPLVKEFSLHKELASYRLKEFYELPNVDLRIQEGRQFLIHNERTYDAIYVASDAATFTYKTGHSRKYLDTREAMQAYFEKLNNDGLIMFQSKPSWPKLLLLKEIWEKNGLDFTNSVIVLSDQPYSHNNVWHHIILKKSPFTPEQVSNVLNHYPALQVIYVPFNSERSDREFEKFLITGNEKLAPKYYSVYPDDDHPYYNRLDFKGFKMIPDYEILNSPLAIVSWMKIQTLIIMVGLALLIFLILLVFKRRKLPPMPVFFYLLISGFAYMLCQVVFIGKLELFLGNPLYSMSLLISIFLFTNAAGSWISDKLDALGIKNWYLYYPFFVAVITLLSLLLTTIAMNHLMHIPLFLKIIAVIIIISPIGFCLGVFYPFSVKWLVKDKRDDSVPVTYGLSTLSSVLGATYAMTVIINLGYTAVLYQATIGYILLGILMLLIRKKIPA